jgi:hypothetical protein
VALALVSVLALAALAAALVLLKSRSDLQRQLVSTQAQAGRLGDDLQAATAQRDDLHDKVEWLTEANARVVDDGERQRERADELAVLLDAATTEPHGSDDTGAGLWLLLLAHVTRRWAAVVGVPPSNRSVVEGSAADQLTQALARETERLREEVGVDVELTAPPRANGANGWADDEPGDRVAVLVAALELLGVLASSAQRVTVDVGDALVLTGDGWVDPYGELAAAYDRVAAAGVVLDPLDVGDERVRLVVHHGTA